ncbi:MAG: GNAT family N-acetyltransferase [Ferroplasma sp.]
MNEMKISEVKNDKEFAIAMQIYNEAFPPEEKRLESDIKKNLISNNEKMFLASKNGIPVLFSMMWQVPGTDFLFLDYIAVKKEFRSSGSGSEFLKTIFERDSNAEYNHIILEVEVPCKGTNREQRQKRIRFYKRAGARIIKGFKYYLPPRGGNEPQEMMLMVISRDSIKRISGNKIRNVVSLIYTHVYNRNKDDSLLLDLISDIPESVNLE